MDNREHWLARTCVELADTLVADFDVIDFMAMVVERCVELLGPAEVGLALAPSADALRVASSTERMRALEFIEVQSDEGPCRDCLHTGKQVLNERLADNQERWPRFAPMARAAGFQMVHALPLRLRDEVIGAMNIFSPEQRELAPADADLIQALADAATIGILQERATRRGAVEISENLQEALDARVVTEQATGVVAESQQVGMAEAFALLRGHARTKHRRLSDVARAIVDRSLAPADLHHGAVARREIVGRATPAPARRGRVPRSPATPGFDRAAPGKGQTAAPLVRRVVWYASYGSNLDADRFASALAGRRETTAPALSTGARHPSRPSPSVPLVLPHRLYFTRVPDFWGAAPAFVDTERSSTHPTLARAYLIGWRQFEDLVAEENTRAPAPLAVADDKLTDGAAVLLGLGRYENLLCVGRRDGVPVVTHTAPWALADVIPRAPLPAYVAVLAGGLRATHGLTDTAVVDYLGAAPGCEPTVVRAGLALLDHGGGAPSPSVTG